MPRRRSPVELVSAAVPTDPPARVRRRMRSVAAITVLLLAGCGPGGAPTPRTTNPSGGGRAIDLAFGGDVLLGEDINTFVAQRGAAVPLAGIPELREADLAVVNLEGVVAGEGDAVDTGTIGDYYFRGRPEMLAVLQAAGIDAVVTGNNHALDYGPAALVQEDGLLTSMGLAHPGAGSTRAQACAPVYLESRGIRVALFSVNTTEPNYPAGDAQGGACYVHDDQQGWAIFRGPIAEAHASADVVLFAPHFRSTFSSTPDPGERQVAQRLIDLGADAVLGSGAHALQGIELYHGHLIVHDAGSLLFNFPQPNETALFILRISHVGVLGVRTVPLVAEHDWTRPAHPAEAAKILAETDDRSRALATQTSDGTLQVSPPPRDPPTNVPIVSMLNPGPAPGPLPAPPSECTVQSVPANFKIGPVRIGPLSLVGVDVQPDKLVGPGLMWVETFWSTAAEVGADLSLAPRAVPARGADWRGPHEPCDWAWPTSRWKPGVVYRDRYPLRPPADVLRLGGIPALVSGVGYGRLGLSIGVQDGAQSLGESGELMGIVLEPAMRTRLILVAGVAAVLAAGVALIVLWQRRTRRSRRHRVEGPG